MGGEWVVDYGVGDNVKGAHAKAHDQAAWDHGHGGYTGSLAEKPKYEFFELPPDLDPHQLLSWIEHTEWNWTTSTDPRRTSKPCLPDEVPAQYRELVEKVFLVSDDKWGPCAAVEIPEKWRTGNEKAYKAEKGEKLYMFFGWASS